MTDCKCVLILDPSLGPGLLANTAAILALSVGKRYPHWIGHDLVDAQGANHPGITTRAIPVLQATTDELRVLRQAARAYEAELQVVDLIDATLHTRSYAEYARAMATLSTEALSYHGLALVGSKKLVSRLTGSLTLLR